MDKTNQIKQYLTYLKAQKAAAATLKRKAASLRKFSQWMKREYPEIAKMGPIRRMGRTKIGQIKPLQRYVAFFIGFVLLAGLGWGIYNQFIARPPETPSLALPTTPPTIISFQGRLTDSVGTPITATVSATFKIYNVGIGGTALWTENKNITPDTDGIFATKLGDTTPMDPTVFRDNMNLWLGIEIDSDGEMADRQQIATVGYAYNSQYLQGYPASSSATINTVPIINNSGDLVIAAVSPTIESTSGDFAILG